MDEFTWETPKTPEPDHPKMDPTTPEEQQQEFERLHREEAEQAFDELFKETKSTFNKFMGGKFL